MKTIFKILASLFIIFCMGSVALDLPIVLIKALCLISGLVLLVIVWELV